MNGHDEELPYRTPVSAAPIAPQHSSVDEGNYDTLKLVQTILNQGMESLSKDFNAFDVLNGEDDAKVTQAFIRNAAGRQIAWDLLSPIQQAINTAVQGIDQKYKQR